MTICRFSSCRGGAIDRTDEYGGALENRARLLREMIEDTKEAVGGSCAVALRLAVDELHGPQGITSEGEGREVVAMLARASRSLGCECGGQPWQ